MIDNTKSPVMEGPPGAVTQVDGRDYLYFGGKCYLGLGGHPEVIEAACTAVCRYGVGTATSRSGYGNSPLVLEVERRSAELFGSEMAFYYPSGYTGNHILIQAAGRAADLMLMDESAHFSLEEASRLAGLPAVRFRHCDTDDLRLKLRDNAARCQRPIVLTDSIFSITGEVAPIDRYAKVLGDYSTATLLIDDGIGIGALGLNGRGTLEHLGLWNETINGDPSADGTGIFVCGTLSKAVGGYGGILPCSRALFDRVRRTSHYYEGASPPMSTAAGATAKALEIFVREPQLRERLRENARRLRSGLRSLGLAVDDWPTPIVGLKLGTSEDMRCIHDKLREAGIIVPYFASYSGSGSAGLLRIAVFATHTPEMLDRLVAELGQLV